MNNYDDFNEDVRGTNNYFDLLSKPETLEILSYLGESRGLEADEMLDEMISCYQRLNFDPFLTKNIVFN